MNEPSNPVYERCNGSFLFDLKDILSINTYIRPGLEILPRYTQLFTTLRPVVYTALMGCYGNEAVL